MAGDRGGKVRLKRGVERGRSFLRRSDEREKEKTAGNPVFLHQRDATVAGGAGLNPKLPLKEEKGNGSTSKKGTKRSCQGGPSEAGRGGGGHLWV